MDDNVGAIVERLEKDRRGNRVVHDQWDAVAVRHFRKRFDVADIAGRVSDRFAENRLGIFVNQPLDRTRAVAFRQPAGDPLSWQDMRKHCVGRSVELRDRDNIATCVSKIDEREVQCGLTAADRERADTALKFGDPTFENFAGRVGDPAVAKALNFQIEQGGAVIGTVECVGCGLIDRDRYGLGGWIRLVSTMYGNGFITHSNWPVSGGPTPREGIPEILSLSRALTGLVGSPAPIDYSGTRQMAQQMPNFGCSPLCLHLNQMAGYPPAITSPKTRSTEVS